MSAPSAAAMAMVFATLPPGALGGVARLGVQLLGLGLVDERHPALGQVVPADGVVVAAEQHVDDRVADSQYVHGCLSLGGTSFGPTFDPR